MTKLCKECGELKPHYKSTNLCWSCSRMGDRNPFWGKKLSEKAREMDSKAKIGEKNPMWKGDSVGLSSLHQWISSRKTKPDLCEGCRRNKPYDLANISQKYRRDINDFEWLCRKCHMKKDGRINNLTPFKKK